MKRLRRIHWFLTLGGPILLGAVMISAPAYASTGAIERIRGNGFACLQPLNGDDGNGVEIVQGGCGGLAGQWASVFIGRADNPTCPPCGKGDVYFLVNSKSGNCLDVRDASTSDGAIIQQWACNGGGSERWWVEPLSNDGFRTYYVYVNLRTKKCLDARSVVRQMPCQFGTASQLFSLP